MKFFRDKLYEDITIPAPPKDDMAEAEVVKKLISNRTATQEKSIADHDQVPFYAIKKYCDDNGMVFHKDEFKDFEDSSGKLSNHEKNILRKNRLEKQNKKSKNIVYGSFLSSETDEN